MNEEILEEMRTLAAQLTTLAFKLDGDVCLTYRVTNLSQISRRHPVPILVIDAEERRAL